MSTATTPSALHTRWQALEPREQRLVLAASAVVALALLWWLALAPALHTLRSAPARHASLDAQLQTMQALRAEALQLQSAPRTAPDTALRALQTSVTERLGTSARLSLSGDRATLTLQGTAADALLPWLEQARSNARAVPQEVHLTRTGAPTTTATTATAITGARTILSATAPPERIATNPADASAGTTARWSGTLVLALPAR